MKWVFGSRRPLFKASGVDTDGTFALAATVRHGQKGGVVIQTDVCKHDRERE